VKSVSIDDDRRLIMMENAYTVALTHCAQIHDADTGHRLTEIAAMPLYALDTFPGKAQMTNTELHRLKSAIDMSANVRMLLYMLGIARFKLHAADWGTFNKDVPLPPEAREAAARLLSAIKPLQLMESRFGTLYEDIDWNYARQLERRLCE
jgi:hypothetical protein